MKQNLTWFEKKELKLDKKLQELARQGKWEETVKALDKNDRNDNRRHKEWRDGMDTTIVDRDIEEDEEFSSAKMLKMSNYRDWEDIIFSRKPEDLNQLVSSPNVCEAIKKLTLKQKRVIFLNIIHQFTNTDIAKITGTSDRNIRKHKEKAIITLKKAIGILKDKSGEGNIDSAVLILTTILFPTFVFGWWAANKIFPKKAA